MPIQGCGTPAFSVGLRVGHPPRVDIFKMWSNLDEKNGNNSTNSVRKILAIYMLTPFFGTYEIASSCRHFFEQLYINGILALD
jgi:hypothetical protein